MGVTAHFLCFDPAHYAEPPSFDRLLHTGDLTEEMEITPGARHVLFEIDSMLGDNKKWYRHIDASWAWEFVREELEPARREELEHWLSHLFYHDSDIICAHQPTSVDDCEVVYDSDYIAHVCALEPDLWDVMTHMESLAEHSEEFVRAKQAASYPWMFDPDGFAWLLDLWINLFRQAHTKRPGWHLLQWVWY